MGGTAVYGAKPSMALPKLSDFYLLCIELALLNDSPRAATVKAKGRLKCATLGKKAFTRLLGPVMEILNRNTENYARIMYSTEGLE